MSTSSTVEKTVQAMALNFQAHKAAGLTVTYQLQLTGDGGGTWAVAVSGGQCSVSPGAPPRADTTITMSADDYLKLAAGRLNVMDAYNKGRVKVRGSTGYAQKFVEIFPPWAALVPPDAPPVPPSQPTPPPVSPPSTPPQPAAPPQPNGPLPVNASLLNPSFDDFQPYIRDGQARYWLDPQYPERYGAHWVVQVIAEGEKRLHLMDSEVFGKFTQKYFGGGGRNYHIHGSHSQVITSRYSFDVVFTQTVAVQSGDTYSFAGSIVSYYKGTSGVQMDGKIFKTIGIDPTGGCDYSSPSIIWGERDGKDNAWRYPVVKAKAQAGAITVFIRLENTDPDVGVTELNIIHLDDFKLA